MDVLVIAPTSESRSTERQHGVYVILVARAPRHRLPRSALTLAPLSASRLFSDVRAGMTGREIGGKDFGDSKHSARMVSLIVYCTLLQ
jgi:hypothetical protein